MSDASRRLASAVLASCGLHAAVALGVHRHERARERTPAQPLWLELQVERREPEKTASAEQPPSAPAMERKRQDVRHVSAPRLERASAEPNAAAPNDTAAETMQAAGEEQTVRLDLSPLAAARMLGDSTSFPWRDAGVARHDEPPRSHTAQADALAQQTPGLRASRGPGRSVEGVVVDAVEDTLYNVLRPWQLLRKTMLGSQYRYTGAGFDAAILPDGQVRYRDKGGPMLTVTATRSREFGPAAQVGPATTAGPSLGDPRALWYRLRGKDPFAAERRLFLERTRALRDHLAGRAAERGALEEQGDVEPEAEPQLEPPADGDTR